MIREAVAQVLLDGAMEAIRSDDDYSLVHDIGQLLFEWKDDNDSDAVCSEAMADEVVELVLSAVVAWVLDYDRKEIS